MYIVWLTARAWKRCHGNRRSLRRRLARDPALKVDVILSRAIGFFGLAILLGGVYMGATSSKVLGQHSALLGLLLSAAWPVDVGLMVGALTLGMVLSQVRYKGTGGHLVQRYLLRHGRLVPVAVIGLISNLYLLLVLFSDTFLHAVPLPVIWGSLFSTLLLVGVVIWSFWGTVQGLNPQLIDSLRHEAHREMAVRAITHELYSVAFQRVLEQQFGLYGISVVNVSLSRDMFQVLRGGYLRHMWLWRVWRFGAPKRTPGLNLQNGSIYLRVGQRIRPRQYLGSSSGSSLLTTVRSGSILWLTNNTVESAQVLREEMIRAKTAVEFGNDGPDALLDALSLFQTVVRASALVDDGQSLGELRRFLSSYKFALTDAVREGPLASHYIQHVSSELNRYLDDVQTAYLLEVVPTLGALNRSPQLLNSLKLYLSLICPAQLRETPEQADNIVKVSWAVMKVWIGPSGDFVGGTATEWSDIFSLWPWLYGEPIASILEEMRTGSMAQLLAFWLFEARSGRDTPLASVFKAFGNRLNLHLLSKQIYQVTQMASGDPTDALHLLNAPFYEWRRGTEVHGPVTRPLPGTELLEGLMLVHAATKILQRVPLTGEESRLFRETRSADIFGVYLPDEAP